MGADSSVNGGWETRQLVRRKVSVLMNKYLVATTGSVRLAQVVAYDLPHRLPLRPFNSTWTYEYYLMEHFVSPLRQCLQDNGLLKSESSVEKMEEGGIMVGFAGRLFSLAWDFSLTEYAEGFDAIGVGRPYALGAMRALKNGGLLLTSAPEDLITRSLEATASFCNGVCGPYYVEVLDGKKETSSDAAAAASIF